MTTDNRPRVLICDPIHADGVMILRQHAEVEIAQSALSWEDLMARIVEFDGVIVRSRTRLPASVINNSTRLQVIARAGAGLDGIDVDAAQANGVEVINAPGANSLAVAEHTFGLLLGLARRLVQADQGMKAGRWEKSKLSGQGLAGRTLGIIGFGNIGRQVARRARGFDMRVIVNQPRLTPELALEMGVEQVDLPDLLRQSDFITLHVPMRPGNEGLIGPAELALMKPTAYLINTARGGIVDEAALLAALEAGKLAGAGLDVFDREPEVNPDLVRHPRVLATPHIAASTEDAQRKAALMVVEKMVTLFQRRGASETFNLRIVPTAQVLPHEGIDPKRVDALAARLEDDGLLVNPPVVARSGDRYVVLDGATRTTALKQLGYPHLVVQQVNLSQSDVQLHTWYHAVRGSSPQDLLALVESLPGLTLDPVDAAQVRGSLSAPEELAMLHLPDGRRFVLTPDGVGGDWLAALNRLVDAYTDWGMVARTLLTDMDALHAQYPELAGLLVFPQFSPELVLEVAGQGRTMPAGITRFVIPGRILRLNAPLEKLRGADPLSVKSSWLDRFVQEKLAYRKVRYYQEPVVLLDE